jgi:hypothetical protein
MADLGPGERVGDLVEDDLIDLVNRKMTDEIPRKGDAPLRVMTTADPTAGMIEPEGPAGQMPPHEVGRPALRLVDRRHETMIGASTDPRPDAPATRRDSLPWLTIPGFASLPSPQAPRKISYI